MNTRRKRAASLALVVLMLLLLVPGSLAEEGGTVSNPVIPGLADGGALLNALDAMNGAALLAIRGDTTVDVGGSIDLTGSSGSSHEWEATNNDGSVKISGQDQWGRWTSTATVTGVAEGEVTITHRYYSWGWHEETYDITVTASDDGALVYYLKTPASRPESNDTSNWGGPVGDQAIVNMTGATWVNSKNALAGVASYIKKWPDGSTGETWTLNDKVKYSAVYQAVYAEYKTELEKELGIVNLELKDIEEITLIPHKISKRNGTTPDKHIDCTISVKCSKAYVARFYVQYPGGTNYTNVSAENKKITDAIDEYVDEKNVPPTITDENGITYRFDGWYNEAGDKVTAWPYTPNQDELADGTVNFYARYVQATTDVTITKRVTGNMGDKSKKFTFTVTSDQAMGLGSYTLSSDGKQATFDLAHSDSVTLKAVPIGAKLNISETGNAGYTSTIKVNDSEIAWEYTVTNDPVTITVTNDNTATIDTGVSLDILPYILLLAVVGGAAVLLVAMSRKRRKED